MDIENQLERINNRLKQLPDIAQLKSQLDLLSQRLDRLTGKVELLTHTAYDDIVALKIRLDNLTSTQGE